MTNIPHAVRSGFALAATVGTGYAACSLLFWLWPEAAADFMNALFHGLDFRRLQADAPAFSFGGFGYALAVMVTWAFGLGAIYGWVSRRVP